CVVKIEGVRDYMTSKYKNTAPAHDAPSLQRKNKQYCVEYKDIAKDRFAVMPVPKNMEFERCADPDDETPTSYVYIGSEKFALVRNDELMALNQRDWNRRQIQRGNAFLANMDRKLFVLETMFMFGCVEIAIIIDLHQKIWFRGVDLARALEMTDTANQNICATINKKYTKSYEQLTSQISLY
ncbi:hypothetical protein PV327_011714, partial [Microctonus hyperodae]